MLIALLYWAFTVRKSSFLRTGNGAKIFDTRTVVPASMQKNKKKTRVSLIIFLLIYEKYIPTERATLLCCANFPFLSYRNCVPMSSFAVRVTTSKELANSHSDPSASPRKPKEEVVTVFKSSKFDSLEV